jgi:serine/threonine protein kinase
LVKRLGGGGKPKEGPIPEHGGVEAEQQQQQQQSLDKSFGYSKNFGAKYELGKEIGRGHFGHTCSATVKKGELKDQTVAVKIISKAKVLIHALISIFSI